MADDRREEPNLELPSLFGRRKRKKHTEQEEPAPAAGPATSDAVADSTADSSSDRATDRATNRATDAAPTATASPQPTLRATGDVSRRRPPPPPPPGAGPSTAPRTPAAEPAEAAAPAAPAPAAETPRPAEELTRPLPVAPREDAPAAQATPPEPPAEQRTTSPAADEGGQQPPSRGPDFEQPYQPRREAAPTSPAPSPRTTAAQPAAATAATAATGAGGTDTLTAPAPADHDGDAEPDTAETEERTRKPRRHLDPRLGAAVVGLVVGLVGVVLFWAAGQGCQAVRGVASCGGLGVGALLLVAVVEVVLGAVLLRRAGQTDTASTSFLAVGMVAVIAMAFFFGALGSVWMFLVLPLLTAAAYVVSTWISTVFVDGLGD